MPKIDLNAGTAVSLFLGGVVALALSLVWVGFWTSLTLSTLWGWFVEPVFKAPSLTILQAYGLALVVRAVRGWDGKQEKSKGFAEVLGKAFITAPFFAGITLLAGWVAKSWM